MHPPRPHPTTIRPTKRLYRTDTTQGKAKQKSWQREVDAGTSQADAEKRYIALVEKLKASYGIDESKAPEAVGGS